MASANSLLGLVNQLQSIETSVVTVLMEAAMKLSSLTDTSIFVLVETPEGRRFSGKRHLCDAYTTGGISPIGNDVEYEVNPAISSLQQRFIPHKDRSTFRSFQSSPQTTSTPRNSARKRLQDLANPPPSPAKHPRPLTWLPSDEIKEEPVVKQETMVDLTDLAEDVDGYSDADGEMPEVIEHLPNEEVAPEAQSLQEFFFNSPKPPSNQNGVVFPDRLGDSIPLPLSFVKKMEAISAINTEVLYEKGSMEYRLLTSCVYQLGSLIAKTAITNRLEGLQVEDFFNKNVNEWFSNFPYLVTSNANGVRVGSGNSGMTIIGFVRHRARNAFRKGYKASLEKTVIL